LPILSLAPYGIRKLVLPVEQIIVNDKQLSSECPNTPIASGDSQIPSESEAEGTKSNTKIQDHINYVQAACNVLSLPAQNMDQQGDLDMCHMGLKLSSATGTPDQADESMGPS
jgi:hypothetical protein